VCVCVRVGAAARERAAYAAAMWACVPGKHARNGDELSMNTEREGGGERESVRKRAFLLGKRGSREWTDACCK
jgi:hypothetical protein